MSSPYDRAREAELVEAAVEGDAQAARELVGLFHGPVYHFVYRFVGQAQDAEDVTQETFVKVFRNLEKVDTSRPIINWLLTIARRTALNHLRARREWVELTIDPVAEEAQPVEEVVQEEQVAGIWDRARRLLKPREFEVLWLRFGEDLSTEEAAQAAGLTASHLKVLLFRARQRLLTFKSVLK